MKDATAAVGTSPDVLQHYLTAGIDLFGPFPKSEHPGEARRLLGLSFDGEGKGIIETENDSGFKDFTYCNYFLPVLRPFSQLVEPLPDGTIPALALAEIIFGDTLTPSGDLSAGLDWFGNVVVTENGVLLFSVSLYWHIKCASDLPAGFEAYDYMRRHHFAVGLEPDQFIPKSAAASPTIKEGSRPG